MTRRAVANARQRIFAVRIGMSRIEQPAAARIGQRRRRPRASTWSAAASASAPVNPRPASSRTTRGALRGDALGRTIDRGPRSAHWRNSRWATMPIWRAVSRTQSNSTTLLVGGSRARWDRQHWRQGWRPPVERQAQQRHAGAARLTPARQARPKAAAEDRPRARPKARTARCRAKACASAVAHRRPVRCRAPRSSAIAFWRACNRRRAAERARRPPRWPRACSGIRTPGRARRGRRALRRSAPAAVRSARRRQRISCGAPLPGAPARPGMTTTSNSSPLARCKVMMRTFASAPAPVSMKVAASASRKAFQSDTSAPGACSASSAKKRSAASRSLASATHAGPPRASQTPRTAAASGMRPRSATAGCNRRSQSLKRRAPSADIGRAPHCAGACVRDDRFAQAPPRCRAVEREKIGQGQPAPRRAQHGKPGEPVVGLDQRVRQRREIEDRLAIGHPIEIDCSESECRLLAAREEFPRGRRACARGSRHSARVGQRGANVRDDFRCFIGVAGASFDCNAGRRSAGSTGLAARNATTAFGRTRRCVDRSARRRG